MNAFSRSANRGVEHDPDRQFPNIFIVCGFRNRRYVRCAPAGVRFSRGIVGLCTRQPGWIRIRQSALSGLSYVHGLGVRRDIQRHQFRRADRFIRAPIGALLGTWSNSTKLVYDVYTLSFTVPGGDIYTISVQGPVPATSPPFAVDTPAVLYPGLLLNTLWFYETERDGPDYIPNALRTAPGHLNDESTTVYDTPPLNNNDLITTTGTPLTSTGAVIDGAGGWWDAGDYMKYVETVSYTTALMEIGVRDFPNQMGPNAPQNPAAPPVSVSYAGNASGAPTSSDFSAEAQFGFAWLMQMWDDSSKTLYYQVDNSQDWKNFPNLETEYDIWTLPQAADDYKHCTTDYFYICYRPGFIAAASPARKSARISPAEWQPHSRSITSFIEPRIRPVRTRRCETQKTFSRWPILLSPIRRNR